MGVRDSLHPCLGSREETCEKDTRSGVSEWEKRFLHVKHTQLFLVFRSDIVMLSR
jgi:hypothetical protein